MTILSGDLPAGQPFPVAIPSRTAPYCYNEKPPPALRALTRPPHQDCAYAGKQFVPITTATVTHPSLDDP